MENNKKHIFFYSKQKKINCETERNENDIFAVVFSFRIGQTVQVAHSTCFVALATSNEANEER